MSSGKSPPTPRHARLEPTSTAEPELFLDELWDRGERPQLLSFLSLLPEPELPLDGLLAVLRVDQRRRWTSGERVSLASYRRDFPVLDANSEALFELLYHELLIREGLGERPDPADYARSYPTLAGRLKLQMQIHEALSFEDDGEDIAQGLIASNPYAPPAGWLPDLPGYEVIEEIGRGGMGVVYRARQLSPARDVALKMILDGRFASVHDLQRFHNEAEAVAALDHPNIVPILEVGQHDSLHYFSMRLLTGGSLDDFNPAIAGDWRAISRLMIDVASAVHHAHQRGVLHRDLKPANILLDDEGRPHVTDFGLAKRVSDGKALTEAGAVMGSPGFMAPEQALGDPAGITTATDVYGLGALLYALLTGRAPFTASSVRETIERLHTEPPESPSRINRFIPRPLEIICLKCLEKEPSRRYPSAEAMADDLEHWLAGEPIAARPASPATRAWLWVRRRPTHAATAAALVALALAGIALGAAKWAWAQADARLQDLRHEQTRLEQKNEELASTNQKLAETRDRAREAADRARDRFVLALGIVDDTFYGFGEGSILRLPSTDGSRKKLLARVIEQYKKIQGALESDPKPEARERLADSYYRLAEMSSEIDSSDIALFASRKAAELRHQIAENAPPSEKAKWRFSEGVAYRKLGGLELKFNGAEPGIAAFKRSYDILDAMLRETPGDVGIKVNRNAALRHMAAAQYWSGRKAEGLKAFEELLQSNEELYRADPRHRSHRFNRAVGKMMYAGFLNSLGRHNEVVGWMEQAEHELRSLWQENPNDSFSTDRLVDSLASLANAYDQQKKPKLALFTNVRACAAADVLARRFPENPRNPEKRADMYWALYERQSRANLPTRALLARTKLLYEQLVRDFPGVDRFRDGFARCLFRQGSAALNERRFVTAEYQLRESAGQYEILARNKPSQPLYYAAADSKMLHAIAVAQLGRRDDAIALANQGATTIGLLKSTPALVVYNYGCLLSLLSGTAPTSTERETLAIRAVAELRKSAGAGYRPVDWIPNDPDLIPLRGRSDFRQYLENLHFPNDPFVPAAKNSIR